MEQKEVLLIVGVLVAGFFLLNNNGMLSGRSVYDTPTDIVTYPNQIGNGNTDAYTVPETSGAGTGSSGSNLCGMTYFEKECTGSWNYRCTSLNTPDIEELRIAKAIASAQCQDCMNSISKESCQLFCRDNYPTCGPVSEAISVEPCYEPVCNAYRCYDGASFSTCTTSGKVIMQCLCVLGAPIEA